MAHLSVPFSLSENCLEILTENSLQNANGILWIVLLL